MVQAPGGNTVGFGGMSQRSYQKLWSGVYNLVSKEFAKGRGMIGLHIKCYMQSWLREWPNLPVKRALRLEVTQEGFITISQFGSAIWFEERLQMDLHWDPMDERDVRCGFRTVCRDIFHFYTGIVLAQCMGTARCSRQCATCGTAASG